MAGGMTDSPQRFDEVAFPALLRGARTAYAGAIQAALAGAECGDLPRNGSFVLGAIARHGLPLSEIIRQLGVSKQAAGQLVDVLVVRGYLDRFPDPGDRRRMTVTLTERGAAAAAAARTAIEQVDADLAGRVGAQYVAHARTVLGALMTAAQEHAAHDHRDHDHGDHRSAAGRDGGGEAGGG